VRRQGDAGVLSGPSVLEEPSPAAYGALGRSWRGRDGRAATLIREAIVAAMITEPRTERACERSKRTTARAFKVRWVVRLLRSQACSVRGSVIIARALRSPYSRIRDATCAFDSTFPRE